MEHSFESVTDAPGLKLVRSMFRRHSESSAKGAQDALAKEDSAHRRSNESPPKDSAEKQLRYPHDSHSHHEHAREKGRDDSLPESPKQPTNVKDDLDHRIFTGADSETKARSTNKKSTDEKSGRETFLTENELKSLFSGAPHFLLEKGRRSRWYPLVIFPWDEHNTVVQHLWDRKPLPHASFTLATLHTHLPVLDDWAKPDEARTTSGHWKARNQPKRATCDFGEFEVPNMLAMNGQEPGSVGFRHFLEIPVSDKINYGRLSNPSFMSNPHWLSLTPATELFEMMEHLIHHYSLCQSGISQGRLHFLRDGPQAWGKIGLRDISFRALGERLQKLQRFYNEIMFSEEAPTILDKEPTRKLHEILFSNFLYAPHRSMLVGYGDPHGLKCQIKVLALVLSTPGAWFDFSQVEQRLRVGQVLWEAPPHLDGDNSVPTGINDAEEKPWICLDLERKWFLTQMLLAGELLLRLDAIVRVAILQGSRDISISSEDIRKFERSMSSKLHWDVITVRRFFENLNIEYTAPHPTTVQVQGKPGEKHRRFSIFGSDSTKKALNLTASESWSAWDCTLLPSRAQQQLDGLFYFAENIGWPEVESFKERLTATIQNGESELTERNIYGVPIRNERQEHSSVKWENVESKGKAVSNGHLVLHCPSASENDHDLPDIGGWVSRSWLSGFVLPGECITHLLMGTLLENDSKALACIGSVASLDGGFVYGGRSWWSNACIVGRVLSCLDGSKTCMGWISVPLLPRYANTSTAVEDAWLEVHAKHAISDFSKPRIKQGVKVALQSTPLGLGGVSGLDFSLPIDKPFTMVDALKVTFDSLALFFHNETNNPPRNKTIKQVAGAVATFTLNGDHVSVTLPLTFDVQFISSYECLPPRGYSSYHCGPFPNRLIAPKHNPHAQFRPGEFARLPGHLLHNSFRYKYIPLEDLPRIAEFPKSTAHAHHTYFDKVAVLDARGCCAKEAFARAWCASIGYDAIIGRVGRTCLACCIREAIAVGARVVIRVD